MVGCRGSGSHPGPVSGYSDLGEMLPGVGDVTLHILADDGLLVGAGHVVPLDTCNRRRAEGGRREDPVIIILKVADCDEVYCPAHRLHSSC